MGRRARWASAGVTLTLLALGISACTGLWDTPQQLPTLLVSDITVTGDSGYVVVSVANMPSSGGAASIQFGTVATPAITIADIDEATIVVEGLAGFTELAWQFTAADGALIAANATTGVVGGQILKITFDITGANPAFEVDVSRVAIGSDLNTLITGLVLGTTDYFTK